MGQSSITIRSTAHRSHESGCLESVALFERLKIAQMSIDVDLHAKNRSSYSLQTPRKRSLVWWNRLNNLRGRGCAQFWLLTVVRILGVDGNSYCNDRRDLDLCRDAALLEHDWRCVIPQCGQPYDRSWIENTLLQIVRQRERLFHLQDLVCSKCCQVKASHLAEQCSCAGAFKCTDNATDFLERMRVFHNIAIYHGFNLLQEVVSWVLELSLPTCS
jgi:hypothetical protein